MGEDRWYFVGAGVALAVVLGVIAVVCVRRRRQGKSPCGRFSRVSLGCCAPSPGKSKVRHPPPHKEDYFISTELEEMSYNGSRSVRSAYHHRGPSQVIAAAGGPVVGRHRGASNYDSDSGEDFANADAVAARQLEEEKKRLMMEEELQKNARHRTGTGLVRAHTLGGAAPVRSPDSQSMNTPPSPAFRGHVRMPSRALASLSGTGNGDTVRSSAPPLLDFNGYESAASNGRFSAGIVRAKTMTHEVQRGGGGHHARKQSTMTFKMPKRKSAVARLSPESNTRHSLEQQQHTAVGTGTGAGAGANPGAGVPTRNGNGGHGVPMIDPMQQTVSITPENSRDKTMRFNGSAAAAAVSPPMPSSTGMDTLYSNNTLMFMNQTMTMDQTMAMDRTMAMDQTMRMDTTLRNPTLTQATSMDERVRVPQQSPQREVVAQNHDVSSPRSPPYHAYTINTSAYPAPKSNISADRDVQPPSSTNSQTSQVPQINRITSPTHANTLGVHSYANGVSSATAEDWKKDALNRLSSRALLQINQDKKLGMLAIHTVGQAALSGCLQVDDSNVKLHDVRQICRNLPGFGHDNFSFVGNDATGTFVPRNMERQVLASHFLPKLWVKMHPDSRSSPQVTASNQMATSPGAPTKAAASSVSSSNSVQQHPSQQQQQQQHQLSPHVQQQQPLTESPSRPKKKIPPLLGEAPRMPSYLAPLPPQQGGVSDGAAVPGKQQVQSSVTTDTMSSLSQPSSRAPSSSSSSSSSAGMSAETSPGKATAGSCQDLFANNDTQKSVQHVNQISVVSPKNSDQLIASTSLPSAAGPDMSSVDSSRSSLHRQQQQMPPIYNPEMSSVTRLGAKSIASDTSFVTDDEEDQFPPPAASSTAAAATTSPPSHQRYQPRPPTLPLPTTAAPATPCPASATDADGDARRRKSVASSAASTTSSESTEATVIDSDNDQHGPQPPLTAQELPQSTDAHQHAAAIPEDQRKQVSASVSRSLPRGI